MAIHIQPSFNVVDNFAASTPSRRGPWCACPSSSPPSSSTQPYYPTRWNYFVRKLNKLINFQLPMAEEGDQEDVRDPEGDPSRCYGIIGLKR